jgi:hypothetical protein
VDLACDPEYDGIIVDDSDIISGSMLSLQLLMHIATGEDSSVFWEEFQKQNNTFNLDQESI